MAVSNVAPSLLIETLIVNLIGEVEKRSSLYKNHLKEYSFENGRPTAYRVSLHTHHQPDYLVDPVRALAAQPDQKSAD
jgi:hypothetical protein